MGEIKRHYSKHSLPLYKQELVSHVHGLSFGLLMILCAPFSALAQTVEQSLSTFSQSASSNETTKRMAFAFQDVPVRALLQVLGETAGVNIVADDSITGTVSLNLKEATWKQALDVIARAKRLRVEQNDNTYFVSADDLSLSSSDDGSGSVTYGSHGQSDVIQLQYQKAEDVRRMIGSDGQRLLSKQGAVTADALTNQLVVQDSPSRVAQIRQLMNKIDVPARQVLIEARIVEADDSFSRSLGVKLGFNDASHSGFTQVSDPLDSSKNISVPVRSGVTFGNNMLNVLGATGQVNTTTVGNMINFPASSNSMGTPAASLALSLYSSGLSRFVNLEVSALETDGKGKVISSPRVVTSNNVTAVIEQGTEIPYQQQANSSGATSVSFRKASLRLEVTPQITPKGDVVMDVDVSKDSVGTLTSAGYTINTKHVKTQVKIENGGTVVIGGIYQEASDKRVEKVPLLGDLPLLGHLFKNTNKSTSKTELLIFLTPHVLDEQGHSLPVSGSKVARFEP
ncbi:type IV pilus secretin PilQ [Hydromonas duriensis]|uniref:Type IV pilus biogenesis and competence protein PilQ n=1 Tax=Hydromonas duriensis TaxID=1527608 RepID=A0A4R6YBN4_9BURK|nr:type IV pilus secretin PilQ [Hydromonas duriensis]TDR33011.1 type IV pilus secretin PilQ/predicted competence protein [Hydromonas duriensis]